MPKPIPVRELARKPLSMMVCLVLLATSRLFALGAPSPITQYATALWDTQRGLPQNSVRAIAQTPDGYLWLGTQEGLARFDGARFTVFNADTTPALPGREISALLATHDGSLWITTYRGGISRYSNGRMTHFGQRDGLPDDVIDSMAEGEDGSVWIGTASGTVGRLSRGRFTSYGSPAGLPRTSIARLLVGKDGALWAGTGLGGIFRLKDGRFTRLTTAEGLSDDRAPAIGQDRDGTIWIATFSGLDRVSNGRIEHVRTGKDVPFRSATALLEGRDRSLWIGTENGGIYRYSDGQFSRLGTENGLPEDNIATLFEDREGSLWAGTMNGGAVQLRPGVFTTISTQEGLPDKAALTVLAARDGTTWIGTTKGIAILRGGRVTRLTTKDGLPSDLIWSLFEDRAGVVWIGTTAGLVRYENGKLRVYTTADGLPNDSIRSITADRAGSMWLSTRGTDNLVRFRDGVFTSYSGQLAFDGSVVGELSEDYDGGLWFGTGRNAIEMRGGKYTWYPLRFTTVAIHHDRDGGHWFGTWGGGLRRIKNGRVTAITTRDGLFDDVAYSIVDDGAGYYWMSCNHGVYRVSKRELNDFADGRIQKVHSLVFGKGDGMRVSDCNHTGTPAASKAPDGRIWFPTSDGVVFVNPHHIRISTAAPSARIEEVLIDNELVTAADQGVRVPPGRRNIEIHYTAISFLAPEKVAFRYRLQGFDEQWVEAGNRRAAYYTNVPPGDYSFQVMGRNNDGLWSGASDPLTVHTVRAYYQTWWFYSLLLLIVATIITRLHLYRVRLLRAEALVQTRELERSLVQAQKMESLGHLASGIAHDFNNTMMSATPWVEILQRNHPTDALQQKATENIRKALVRAKDVTRRLLDFALPNSPAVKSIDIKEFLEQQLPLLRASLPPEVLIDLQIEELPLVARADPAQLSQAIVNLAVNARDAMPDGGRLCLEARQPTFDEGRKWNILTDSSVILTVSDTGTGMDQQTLSKIFDPFFTTKDIGKGSGLGLSVVHRIMEQHKGAVFAESVPRRGTTFYLVLPRAEPMIKPRPIRAETAVDPLMVGVTVLLIEDEVLVSEGVQTILELEGANVTVAHRGAPALAMLNQGFRPDLIILDLGLPEMSGERIFEQVRKCLPTVPIVIASGFGEGARGEKLKADVFTRFRPKPYEIAAIIKDYRDIVVSASPDLPLAMAR